MTALQKKVSIDRKEVGLDGTSVNLLLWDIEGRTDEREVSPSYLRGSSGLIFVVDGTRRETCDQVSELREHTRRHVGDVPSVVAINKNDLTDQWQLDRRAHKALKKAGWYSIVTSAKTGEGVEDAFRWLAAAMVGT